MADSQELARPVIERLSEDERLRGSTSDSGFGPLLDWASAAAISYSTQAATPAAMEAYGEKLRDVISAAVAAAEAGQVGGPAPLLDWDAANPSELKAALAGLKLAGDVDENAASLAEVLQAAVKPAPAPVQAAPPPAEKQPAPPAPAADTAPAVASLPEPAAASLPEPAAKSSAPAAASASPKKSSWLNRLGAKAGQVWNRRE